MCPRLIEMAFCVAVFLVFGFVSSMAFGQELDSVGVVVLDAEKDDTALIERISRNLPAKRVAVVSGTDLVARYESRQAAPVEADVPDKFKDLTGRIAAGVKKFFYENNREAVTHLSPIFDLGMHHRRYLAARPDIADHIYEAGIVLVRAHEGAGDRVRAEAVVRLMVKYFPSKRPSASMVPPKVIRQFEEIADEVGAAESKLVLQGIESEGCTPHINGIPSAFDVPISVHPEISYFVGLDCGEQHPVIWTITPETGGVETIPLSGANPLTTKMPHNDFGNRRRAEMLLQTLAYWTGLQTIIGVSREGVTSEAVLVVRVERGGGGVWSDAADDASIRRALLAVFPEVAAPAAPRATEAGVLDGESDSAEGGWPWGWIALSTGGAFLIGGGVGLWLAEERSLEIACSSDVDSSPFFDGQAGSDVERLTEEDCAAYKTRNLALPTKEDYDSAISGVDNTRILSYSALGVGVVGVAYGIYRLVTDGEPEPASVGLGLRGDGLEFRLRWTY